MTSIIGFDTATERTVVGATVDGESVFEFRSDPVSGARPAHSVELLPAIESAAGALGGWPEVDLIGVGIGPGTYTGLRIAIATARGLALSGAAGTVGVPTLEAMARSIGRRNTGSVAVPVLDAKRGEVFYGAWGIECEELHPATVGTPSELVEVISHLPGTPVVAGPGAVRFHSELRSRGLEPTGEDDPSNELDGFAICEIADLRAGQGKQEELEPIYLRAPDAERWTGLAEADGSD